MDSLTETDPNPLLAGDAPPQFGSVEARHVRPAVALTLESQRRKLEQLAAVETPTLEWLRETEKVLERVNDVWNPVAHLNSVASNAELREAYNDCLAKITEFYTDLGQDAALFRRFESLAEQTSDGPEAELIRQSLREFRLAGVGLEDEDREAFRKLSLELAACQAEFEQNLMDATDAFEHHVEDEAELSGLPEQLLARARIEAADRDLGGWLLKLDPPTYQSIMTLADSRELRQRYYRAWVTRASGEGDGKWNNGPLIERILRLRQASAELLGFENFAAMSLARKMADSEQQVLAFLEDLAARSRGFAREEFARLEEFAGTSLEAWDLSYYAEKLRQQTFNIGDEELRAYFPLPRVLNGMFGLTEKLFGLRISETTGAALWHESVRAFRIDDLDGTPVGMLLTDFYARPNKRGGAWMDSCANRSRLGELARNPIAHLICNFAPPAGESPSYLTHNDVLTLFHEFGHALHHLLTEVDLPSIAGINGVAWDAVELPSQFFENYAWHPDVLKNISAHRETGEPIPADKIATLIESRTFHAGLAMLRQIEFALFDFRLHARSAPPDEAQVQALMDEVRREISVVPTPSFNRFQCSFAHIFAGGYAAGYYSYKWAEVLAADAFAAFEESGAFDPATAERFRRAILAVGGSRDAMDSFVAFRGREPELDPLLRQAGIVN